MKDLVKNIYRSRLIINFNDRHLVSVSSKVKVVVDNPILAKDLQ